jgi:hypothetical protein
MPNGSRSPVPDGYRGLTREACTLDLRQFTGWCRTRSLLLFSVRRADIETFARELEAKGRARATVSRRLRTIAGTADPHSPGSRLMHCRGRADWFLLLRWNASLPGGTPGS